MSRSAKGNVIGDGSNKVNQKDENAGKGRTEPSKQRAGQSPGSSGDLKQTGLKDKGGV